MSKPFAQLTAIVFLIVGVGGFITGDASHVVHRTAGGNLDGVALHMTWLRDVIDLLFAAAFGYAGWGASFTVARTITLACGAVLLLLAVVGFALSDDAAGTRSLVTLHFPLAMNIFDLTAGTLAVLCGLGDLGAATSASAQGRAGSPT